MSRILIPTSIALVGVLALTGAVAAQTRTCHGEVARLDALIAEAEAGGPPVPDMKEGNFATMHHQPTEASILAADKDAMARAKTALDRARQFETQGKEAACLKALDDVAF